MTSFHVAMETLKEQLPTLKQAKAFRDWLNKHDWQQMGAIGIEAEHNPGHEAALALFAETEFWAMEGRYRWPTSLLDYFRFRSTDEVWLGRITGADRVDTT